MACWTYEITNLTLAQKPGSNRYGAAMVLHVTAPKGDWVAQQKGPDSGATWTPTEADGDKSKPKSSLDVWNLNVDKMSEMNVFTLWQRC